MSQAQAERDGAVLWVQGDLDFTTVVALWEQTETLFAVGPPTQIDLGGVGRANSAGVALLVAWLERAQRVGQSVRFVRVPTQMQAIIAVADLETLLPLA